MKMLTRAEKNWDSPHIVAWIEYPGVQTDGTEFRMLRYAPYLLRTLLHLIHNLHSLLTTYALWVGCHGHTFWTHRHTPGNVWMNKWITVLRLIVTVLVSLGLLDNQSAVTWCRCLEIHSLSTINRNGNVVSHDRWIHLVSYTVHIQGCTRRLIMLMIGL